MSFTAPLYNDQLSTLLLKNEFLSPEVVEGAVAAAAEKKHSLYEELVESQLLSDENLGTAIADHVGLPFKNLSPNSVSEDLLKLIPQAAAKETLSVIFGMSPESVELATASPSEKDWFEMVAKKFDRKVVLHYATPKAIESILFLYKNNLQEAFSVLLQKYTGETGDNTLENVPISTVVDTLIEYAYQQRASDIHIEPFGEYSLIRFRIDGVLQDALKFPIVLHDRAISRIKVIAKLRTDEHLSAQDGKFQATQQDEELDIRVSVVPQIRGEKAVLRLLSSRNQQFGLSDLGLLPSDQAKLEKAIQRPFGMILSTGPTGSGKTTTMYSLLKLLNKRERNIATIEDPVEYQVEGINQIQVNNQSNLTFAQGLRSLLRQDPDILYVGEIRDEETAQIAVNAATTGHLVLSTLHTNNSATAVIRLLDMKIQPFLIATTINVVIAQRLVRTICPSCKESYTVTAKQLENKLSSLDIKKYLGSTKDLRLFRGKGCKACRMTGFQGRQGIYEVMEVTPELEALITARASSDQIQKKAIEQGMTTMLADGLQKVQQGTLLVDELLRVVEV